MKRLNNNEIQDHLYRIANSNDDNKVDLIIALQNMKAENAIRNYLHDTIEPISEENLYDDVPFEQLDAWLNAFQTTGGVYPPRELWAARERKLTEDSRKLLAHLYRDYMNKKCGS